MKYSALPDLVFYFALFFSVTWDTRVKDVMPPDFAFYDELRTEHATIRDLLSHRMGIPSHNRLRMQSTLTRQTLYK